MHPGELARRAEAARAALALLERPGVLLDEVMDSWYYSRGFTLSRG
jgi:hypothetical protein